MKPIYHKRRWCRKNIPYGLREINVLISKFIELQSHKTLKTTAIISIHILCLTFFTTVTIADEKNQEDPTKIVTRIGIGYSDQFTISGSIGLDKVRMIHDRL